MKSYLSIAPASLQRILKSVYHFFFKYGHIYYSQNGEDIILSSHFKKKQTGFYVDFGAHHPTRYSNTYLLYKKGWRGINVDANESLIRGFLNKRPRDISICKAIGDDGEQLEYFMFEDAAVNTFSPSEAQKWKGSKWNKYLGSKIMTTESPNTILKKYLPPDTTIDLMSIDLEGLDYKFLRSLDFDVYRPNVIVVEDTDFNFSEPAASQIYKYLDSKNYTLISVVKFSLIFKSKS